MGFNLDMNDINLVDDLSSFGFKPYQSSVGTTGTMGGAGLVGGKAPTWVQKNITGFTDDTGLKFDSPAMMGAQLGLGALQGYLGMKNYGLAKRELKNNERMFTDQFNQQVALTNMELADRQRIRNRENPNSIPVDEYMAMYGLQKR